MVGSARMTQNHPTLYQLEIRGHWTVDNAERRLTEGEID